MVIMSGNDSDGDFWDVGGEEGPRPARRRRGSKKSSGMRDFSLKRNKTSERGVTSISLSDSVETTNNNTTDDQDTKNSSDKTENCRNNVASLSTEAENEQITKNGNIYEDDYQSSFESDDNGSNKSSSAEEGDEDSSHRGEDRDHRSNDNGHRDRDICHKDKGNGHIDRDRGHKGKNTGHRGEDSGHGDEDIGVRGKDITDRDEDSDKNDNIDDFYDNCEMSEDQEEADDHCTLSNASSDPELKDVNFQKSSVIVVLPNVDSVADVEEGNNRQEGTHRTNPLNIKKNGKLLKWQSQSSSDIKTTPPLRSSSEPMLGTEHLYRRCDQSDVGYPPAVRLKNALYRGRKSLASNDADGAIEEFVRSYALARIVHGDQHWRTCRCRVFLAQSYLYLKEFYPQAESEARAARDTLVRNFDSPAVPRKKLQVRQLLAVSALLEAESRVMQGRLEAAQAPLDKAHKHALIYEKKVQLDEALKYAEGDGGPKDQRLVKLLQQYGELLIIHPRQEEENCGADDGGGGGVGGSSGAAAKTNISDTNKDRQSLSSNITSIKSTDILAKQTPNMQSLDTDEIKESSSRAELDAEEGLAGVDAWKIAVESAALKQDSDEETDIMRGLAMLRRAVYITKCNNRPGSEVELDSRALLVRHEVLQEKADPVDALRELHSLYTIVTRSRGDASVPAIALQALSVQVHLQLERYDQATKELHKVLNSTRRLYGDYSRQVCNVLRQLWHVRAHAKDLPGLGAALSQLLAVEVLVFGANSARTNSTRDKLRETLQRVPVSLRLKLERRHPELQVRPRFRSQ